MHATCILCLQSDTRVHTLCTMAKLSELIDRLPRSVTQREIARDTGIPQPRLSRWFKRVPPSAEDAIVLAEWIKRELRREERKASAGKA